MTRANRSIASCAAGSSATSLDATRAALARPALIGSRAPPARYASGIGPAALLAHAGDEGIFAGIGADPDMSGRLRAGFHLPASQVPLELPQERRHVALDAPMDLGQSADGDAQTVGSALKEPGGFVVGAGEIVSHGPQHPNEGRERVDIASQGVPREQDVASRRGVEASLTRHSASSCERARDGL